jgi:hypothetical protein
MESSIKFGLFKHQSEFVNDITTRNLLLVGGFGSGKTKALAVKLIILCMLNAGCIGIALSPTYGMATKNLIPTIEEELYAQNIPFTFNKSELQFFIKCPNGKTTRLLIMAAESYKRCAGINAAFFGIDEADLLSLDIFTAAWRMLTSRLRKGIVYQAVAVSTPEGFKGCWTFFVDNPAKTPKIAHLWRIIRAKTKDNFTLPPEYIESLEQQYAGQPELLAAYMEGNFVNMTGLPVYTRYKPAYDGGNWTNRTLDHFDNTHPLHIGLDFNKGINPCIVHVVSGGVRYAVDEIYGLRDTDSCIAEIKKRYAGRILNFYPDANGFEERNNYEKNFGSQRVHYDEANPRVFKRVASLHIGICNPLTNERKYFVNPEKCPNLDKSLQKQVYNKKQEPDKDGGFDHACDSAGYWHVRFWPADQMSLRNEGLRI